MLDAIGIILIHRLLAVEKIGVERRGAATSVKSRTVCPLATIVATKLLAIIETAIIETSVELCKRHSQLAASVGMILLPVLPQVHE